MKSSEPENTLEITVLTSILVFRKLMPSHAFLVDADASCGPEMIGRAHPNPELALAGDAL